MGDENNKDRNPLLGSNLTYYIFDGVLVGYADGRFIHIFARSGGGGGVNPERRKAKKDPKPIEPEAINNPYAIARKASAQQRGGPIPPGRYVIGKPTKEATATGKFKGVFHAELRPDRRNNMFHRGGFYIHGRGADGSDGCIVPTVPKDFETLMNALERDGGGILYVEETTEGGRFA